MFYVYALYNKVKSKIYIGQTNNLERRLAEHNNRLGNHYTSKIEGKWNLIYQEEVSSRSGAIRREKELKSFKGREFIKQHIPR